MGSVTGMCVLESEHKERKIQGLLIHITVRSGVLAIRIYQY